MAKPDFQSVLDMMPNDIERPKQLPPGGYICINRDQPVFDKSRDRETPFVLFNLHPVEALENVDEERLKETLTRRDGSRRQLSDMTIRAQYWLTDDAAFRLKKFLLDDCEVENTGSIGQLIENSIGCQVIANIKHKIIGDEVYVNLETTAPVSSLDQPKKAAARR